MCGVEKVYRHLLERVRRQYGYVQNVPRHLTNVVELRPNQIVQTFIDFRTHTIKEPDWGELTGEATWQMKDGYILWYTRVSHPMILRLLPGDLLRTTNEEQIIAQQWEQYEARGSPDANDMINGVVAYADEQLGQEVMSHEQWSAAMRHVREHITPILPEGEPRGRGGSNSSMSRTISRITCSCCFGLVFYFSYFYDIGSYVCILMTCSRTLALTMLVPL
jgi:hypothetical protein